MNTERKIDYSFKFLSFNRRCSTKCTTRNQTRFQFLRLLVPGPYFSLRLVTKSLVDLFLILGIMTFPIFCNTCRFSATPCRYYAHFLQYLQIFCNTLQIFCNISRFSGPLCRFSATICVISAEPAPSILTVV